MHVQTDLEGFEPETWPQFQKKVPIRALRMDGPFTVDIFGGEGTILCEDGWLCIDARGYPYPVAAEEFDLIYEPYG